MGSGARARARGFKPRDNAHVEESQRRAESPTDAARFLGGPNDGFIGGGESVRLLESREASVSGIERTCDHCRSSTYSVSGGRHRRPSQGAAEMCMCHAVEDMRRSSRGPSTIVAARSPPPGGGGSSRTLLGNAPSSPKGNSLVLGREDSYGICTFRGPYLASTLIYSSPLRCTRRHQARASSKGGWWCVHRDN